MKRSLKIALLAAGISILVGLFLIFTGLLMVSFDFSRLSTADFETNTYEIAEDFQSIHIQTNEHNITLQPSADGSCRLICTDSDRVTHSMAVENGTLTVRRTDNRRWYQHIGIYLGEDDELSVTLFLPKDRYDALYAKSVSGDITLPDGFSFAELELTSTSGEIMVQSSSASKLSVSTVSGDIELSGTTAQTLTVCSTSGETDLSRLTAESLRVQTTSGDQELQELQIAGPAELETTSGEVALKDTLANSVQIQTVSGDIALKNADASAFTVKTGSGWVEGTLRSGKLFTVHTTSGSIRVPDPDPAGGTFDVTTVSGDVTLKIAS